MARYLKRNSGWYVQIRRKGHDSIALRQGFNWFGIV
ncbi:MAG: hypothetical protein RLZ75_2235 [Pseudomonadota bacterium]